MMTLSVSSGTWNDAMAAGYGETSDTKPAGYDEIDRVVRAALRELKLEIKIEPPSDDR